MPKNDCWVCLGFGWVLDKVEEVSVNRIGVAVRWMKVDWVVERESEQTWFIDIELRCKVFNRPQIECHLFIFEHKVFDMDQVLPILLPKIWLGYHYQN